MTGNADFDRRIFDFLDREAGRGSPDYLDDILRRTAHTSQRPAWSSMERLLQVNTSLYRSVFDRPAPMRALAILVVIGLLIAAIAAVAVGTQQSRLEPFGVARNGTLVYSASDGDIHALNPATGQSNPIITGSATDLAPLFSRDGSRFVFARETGVEGQHLIMLANADGTGVRPLSDPLVGLEGYSWSPDSSRVAVDSGPDGAKALTVIAMDGTTVRLWDSGIDADSVQWRPNGRELVFRGVTSGPEPPTYGLYVVGADGTDLREILPKTDSDGHWQFPALSPDGSQIIYTQFDPAGGGNLFVVDVDSGAMKILRFPDYSWMDYFAAWSPDGSRIVFFRGRAQDSYHLAVAPAVGGPVVNIGPDMPWGHQEPGAFSPDGSKVIAKYGDGSTWVFPVDGGAGEPLPSSEFVASWQRLPS
jgi:dipeptidyl aminopeptidase/acylaminoacyl peptidase